MLEVPVGFKNMTGGLGMAALGAANDGGEVWPGTTSHEVAANAEEYANGYVLCPLAADDSDSAVCETARTPSAT